MLKTLVALVVTISAASATPVRLRCEYRENPLGIDALAPRLSWQSDSAERNWKQSAYQVLVAGSPDTLRSGRADVWDSGKTNSDESVEIVYKGPALESRKRYYWKVRVWDASGKSSESTEESWWEMGLLHPTDWTAKWIAWRNPEDEADRKDIRWIWLAGQDALAAVPKSSATFRVNVQLAQKPRGSVLLVSARGDYTARQEAHLGGV
jgi:alpha-L-rhamnosidase